VQGVVRCPGLVFFTQQGRTIYLRGEEHEDVNHCGESGQSANTRQLSRKDYTVKASVGHIRDLPPYEMAVDVDNDFRPTYVIVEGKQDVVARLKKAANWGVQQLPRLPVPGGL